MNTSKTYSFFEIFVFIAFALFVISFSMNRLYETQKEARFSRARADVLLFKRVALVGLIETKQENVSTITKRSCSVCLCDPTSLNNCRGVLNRSFEYISASTQGLVSIPSESYIDPWGSPYGIDESYKINDTCGTTFFSSGPDKNPQTQHDNVATFLEQPCK